MTRRAKSYQVGFLIVVFVLVVVMNMQRIGTVMSAATQAALKPVSFSNLVLEPAREFGSVDRERMTSFPSRMEFSLCETGSFQRAFSTAKILSLESSRSSHNFLSTVRARQHDGGPTGNWNAVLVYRLAVTTTKALFIVGNVGGSSGEGLAAFGALDYRGSAATSRLRACVATAGRRPVLQKIAQDSHGLSAMSARQDRVSSSGYGGVPASKIAVLPARPNRSGELLSALGAVGHSSIFPCWLQKASTSGSTG